MNMNFWEQLLVEAMFLWIGPTCILVNHYILNNLHFPFPICLAGCGVAASALLSWILITAGIIKIEKKDVAGLWYRGIMPLGASTALSMATGNAVYLYLNISFIQMLKSFTPVVLLLTAYATQLDKPKSSVVYSICIIAAGTAISCFTTGSLSTIGILLMLCSQFAEALRLLVTQYFLKQMKFGVIEGQYYLLPVASLWLFGTSALLELPQMYEVNALSILWNKQIYFWMAACTGVLVNFFSYLVIKISSSLTVTVLGTVRNILLVFIGVVFYQDKVSFQEVIGYIIAILGFVVYHLQTAKIGSSEFTKGDDMLLNSKPDLRSPLRAINPGNTPLRIINGLSEEASPFIEKV